MCHKPFNINDFLKCHKQGIFMFDNSINDFLVVIKSISLPAFCKDRKRHHLKEIAQLVVDNDLFNKDLLNTYHVPDTGLRLRDENINKIQSLTS